MYAAGASFNIVVCLSVSLFAVSMSSRAVYIRKLHSNLSRGADGDHAVLNCYDKWFSQYCAQSGSQE